VRSVLALAAAAAVIVVTATPGIAASTVPVGVWEMNEAPGATVMTDSGPNGLNGTIGTELIGGYSFDGSTGYDFAWLRPNTAPAHPQHGVTVPDSDKLDPGTRDYSVTLRMRTTHSFGNVIQKGQGGAAGGRWKIEAPRGLIVCAFQGSSGYVEAKAATAIDDGRWHVVTCERTAKYVTLTIDGVVQMATKGATGAIANTWPLAIGGKTSCDQIKVTCDYFPGEIDRVEIDASS
jgi:hypothetical protein